MTTRIVYILQRFQLFILAQNIEIQHHFVLDEVEEGAIETGVLLHIKWDPEMLTTDHSQ